MEMMGQGDNGQIIANWQGLAVVVQCGSIYEVNFKVFQMRASETCPFSAWRIPNPTGNSRRVSLMTAVVYSSSFVLYGESLRILNVLWKSGSKTSSCSSRNFWTTSEFLDKSIRMYYVLLECCLVQKVY